MLITPAYQETLCGCGHLVLRLVFCGVCEHRVRPLASVRQFATIGLAIYRYCFDVTPRDFRPRRVVPATVELLSIGTITIDTKLDSRHRIQVASKKMKIKSPKPVGDVLE
jgi:hypothetical protein